MNETSKEQYLEWREAILKLPDQKFFDLMTFYLGEIETPFNKQDLIDRLSAFLRKTEVQEKIIMRISEQEASLLSCIMLNSRSNQEFLKNFFHGELNHYQLLELLNNLEQRLIVFKPKSNESIVKLNPYLAKKLTTLASLHTFLLPVQKAENISRANLLNNINILSAYSFFLHNPAAAKNNGELKKKTFERAESIFVLYRDNLLSFNFLLRAFLNLNLFSETENGISANEAVWKKFARLNSLERRCYIIVAASAAYSEKYLILLAHLLSRFFELINPEYFYDKRDLEKAFSIVQENLYAEFLGSEIFSSQEKNYEVFFQNQQKTIIELAEMFGVLVGNDKYLTINSNLNEEDENKTILVSPAFEVTIFPSDNFENLLPLVSALTPTSVQTTALFELNRKTSGLFFERKGNYETLKKIFLENITGELPQNIDISLKQWYQNFSSVKLYEGIIAMVSKEKSSLFEKNMPLESLVEVKLTDTIFVLRSNDLPEIREALNRAGLECLVEKERQTFKPTVNFNIKTFAQIEADLPFEKILEKSKQRSVIFKSDIKKDRAEILKKCNADKKLLFEKVKALDLEKSEKDFLNEQITKNIIFDEAQITGRNIKFESLQVSALDYSAKLRLCESAVTQNKKLEIAVEVSGKHKTFYCMPLEVIRGEQKDLLRLIIDGTEKIKNLNISKIAKLKIVKDSIF